MRRWFKLDKWTPLFVCLSTIVGRSGPAGYDQWASPLADPLQNRQEALLYTSATLFAGRRTHTREPWPASAS